MSAPIVFIDTETTGLHPDRRPWEIALIRRDAVSEEAHIFTVRDVDLSNAEPKALQMNGFYERHPIARRYAAPSSSEARVAPEVERITRGAYLVGAVPSFDAECLAAMLRRHKLAPSWRYQLIDIESMAIGFLSASIDWRQATPEPPFPFTMGLSIVAQALKIDPDQFARHEAIGDARLVQAVYDEITEGAFAATPSGGGVS